MIQRIQSIYLLVAGIVTIVLLFIPIGTLTSELGFYTYTSFYCSRNQYGSCSC